jgi:hypothetical protein
MEEHMTEWTECSQCIIYEWSYAPDSVGRDNFEVFITWSPSLILFQKQTAQTTITAVLCILIVCNTEKA